MFYLISDPVSKKWSFELQEYSALGMCTINKVVLIIHCIANDINGKVVKYVMYSTEIV